VIDLYDWAGGSEAMLRFGPQTGPIVVLALPLFEEANRTRTFAVTMLRALAEQGVASVLPDFPGQGESGRPTIQFRLSDARQAYDDLVEYLSAPRRVLGVSIRSGALIGGQWQFSPVTGSDLFRDLGRIRHLATGDRFDSAEIGDAPIEFAGNLLSPNLLAELDEAAPRERARIVRLENDPRKADLKLPGTPLWRRSEPGNDVVLAQMLASDIAEWIETCDA
jgi:hypothetical protein